MSFPNHVKGEARKTLGRKWGKQSAEVRAVTILERGIDWETQVYRSKQDRRGTLIAEGHDYRATAIKHWVIRHRVAGSTDQVDLVIEGQCWRCGSLETARQAVKWNRWPVSISGAVIRCVDSSLANK